MTKTTNPLKLAIADALGPAGFSRKGDSWYRKTDEVVEVVNLQKSQYGPQYYFNYALWLLPLGEAAFPKEEKCHIRMRADDIVSSETELERLLDLEAANSDAERMFKVAALLKLEFLPFADGCRTIRGLRLFLETGKFRKSMVHFSARQLLNTIA